MGQPAGSAVPLVWAHAEYLKLLRSAVDGKVFDRIDRGVRALLRAGGAQAGAAESGDLQPAPADPEDCRGETLRILDESRFEVIWSSDGWKTTQTTMSRSLGSAGFSADIPPREPAERWTIMDFPLAGAGRWLGYNVEVKVEASNALKRE